MFAGNINFNLRFKNWYLSSIYIKRFCVDMSDKMGNAVVLIGVMLWLKQVAMKLLLLFLRGRHFPLNLHYFYFYFFFLVRLLKLSNLLMFYHLFLILVTVFYPWRFDIKAISQSAISHSFISPRRNSPPIYYPLSNIVLPSISHSAIFQSHFPLGNFLAMHFPFGHFSPMHVPFDHTASFICNSTISLSALPT